MNSTDYFYAESTPLYYYYDHYYGNEYYEYDLFVFEGFDFERPIYLYLWELFVVITTLANILVISVFMHRSMRNSTNVILITIAVTDSMTGVVTLPVYIYVYNLQKNGNVHLTENWCEVFMVVKFYVSKTFHTMSIWLTVCLGFQRLVSVCFPFRAQSLFTVRRTLIMIFSIIVLSPVLHLYHAVHRKSIPGDEMQNKSCTWQLEEPCTKDCIHIWVTFYLMHFIPCLLLIVFTAAMVIVLSKTFKKMKLSHLISNKNNLLRRNADSRRISLIVVTVVIIFLIPEIPFGMFLLLNVSFHLSRAGVMSLKVNRVFHCVYEIALVLSFHANFWIYFIMNRRFRQGIKKLFAPVYFLCCGIVGNIRRSRRSDTSSFAIHLNTQHTSGGHEMNTQQSRDLQRKESAEPK